MDSSFQTSPNDALVAMSNALAGIVERVGASTFAVLGRRGHAIASAVLWQPGVLVSAAHVFRRQPTSVTVVGGDGRSLDAAWLGSDPSTDIAAFRLADNATPVAALGDAAGVRAGQIVIAVGRSAQGELNASHGIVARASGPWQTWLGGSVDRLIRLDGGLFEGMSGGPVADARGAVIGIGSAALSRSHGIVLPASTVSRVLGALLAGGSVGRPYLGIAAQAVPVPGSAGVEGLLVTALAADGPASQAGVLVGDILTGAAGVATGSLQALRAALAAHIGKTVSLALMRGGVPAERAIVVGAWPAGQRAC